MTELFPHLNAPMSPEDQRLVEAYVTVGRPLDDLPYTPEMDQIVAVARRSKPNAGPRDVLQRLLNLRKAARLPRLGRATDPAPHVSEEFRELISDIVTNRLRSIGKRDQLPYSDDFAAVHAEFSQRSGMQLTEHELWRLIANVAK